MKKILVVDDDPVTLKIVEGILTPVGYHVSVAQNGFEAIEKVEAQGPHLVIADINMPGGISGFQLCQRLRQADATKRTPFILISGRREKADVVRAQKVGADAYIVKPIQPDGLRSKVEELLKTSALVLEPREVGTTSKGNFTLTLEVVGVNPQGLTIRSPIPFPLDYEFSFASNIFHQMGMTTPHLRVLSSELLRADAGYVVKVAFQNLSESDDKSLRRWIANAA